MNAILLAAVLCGGDLADWLNDGGTIPVRAVSFDAIGQTQRVRVAVVQPAVVYAYPTRGGNWTFPGSGRQDLIHHLLTDGIHRGSFSRAQLEAMSYAQLRALHSDQHEGRVRWSYLRPVRVVTTREVLSSGYVVPVPLTAKQRRRIEREQADVEKEIGRAIFGTRDGKHPGPVGGWIRGTFFNDPRYRTPRYYTSGPCPGGLCPVY